MHKYIKIYITQPKQGTPRKRNIKQGVPLPNTYTLSLRRCHSRSPARTTYIHIRQTTLTISSTTVKPNHPHEMPLFTLHNIYEYLLTIKTMQQKVLHSMNTTHLQKFSLLAPVPWDRNSISIRFKKYQKLRIG